MDGQEVKKLKEWFLSERREMPWRENPTPYRVWVSEVMLQQTQVSVVIPYFERWMDQFPTIQALAQASIEDVLKEWEGLGYYSRARNLHEGARFVLDKYQGVLPSNPEELLKIKGLGSYTVGAILNFAFHQKAAAVDGNVMRVLSRYYALDADIGKAKTVKMIQALAYDLLPGKDPWVITEALIELGATVCSRSAKCQDCPLKQSCQAFAQDLVDELPIKSAKTGTTSLFRTVAVVFCRDYFLVRRGEKGKVMADLFEFPYFELESAEIEIKFQKELILQSLKFEADWQKALPLIKHSFTRYRALLIPHLFTAKTTPRVEGFEWHSLNDLKKLPFSSGHRQILNLFDVC